MELVSEKEIRLTSLSNQNDVLFSQLSQVVLLSFLHPSSLAKSVKTPWFVPIRCLLIHLRVFAVSSCLFAEIARSLGRHYLWKRLVELDWKGN